jgi:hypothetical protein
MPKSPEQLAEIARLRGQLSALESNDDAAPSDGDNLPLDELLAQTKSKLARVEERRAAYEAEEIRKRAFDKIRSQVTSALQSYGLGTEAVHSFLQSVGGLGMFELDSESGCALMLDVASGQKVPASIGLADHPVVRSLLNRDPANARSREETQKREQVSQWEAEKIQLMQRGSINGNRDAALVRLDWLNKQIRQAKSELDAIAPAPSAAPRRVHPVLEAERRRLQSELAAVRREFQQAPGRDDLLIRSERITRALREVEAKIVAAA